jgi:hypothetical protein
LRGSAALTPQIQSAALTPRVISFPIGIPMKKRRSGG